MINPLKVNGKINIIALIIGIIISEGAAAACGYIILKNSQTYESLIKPSYSPPAWALEIAWPILYFLLGIAVYRIWMRGEGEVGIKKVMSLYVIQLVLTIMWPIIFLKWRLVGLAFFELILLLIFILLTTFRFLGIDKLAGFLTIVYVLWISLIGVHNFTLWMLNNM